jgi:hypothetical protein
MSTCTYIRIGWNWFKILICKFIGIYLLFRVNLFSFYGNITGVDLAEMMCIVYKKIFISKWSSLMRYLNIFYSEVFTPVFIILLNFPR